MFHPKLNSRVALADLGGLWPSQNLHTIVRVDLYDFCDGMTCLQTLVAMV